LTSAMMTTAKRERRSDRTRHAMSSLFFAELRCCRGPTDIDRSQKECCNGASHVPGSSAAELGRLRLERAELAAVRSWSGGGRPGTSEHDARTGRAAHRSCPGRSLECG